MSHSYRSQNETQVPNLDTPARALPKPALGAWAARPCSRSSTRYWSFLRRGA